MQQSMHHCKYTLPPLIAFALVVGCGDRPRPETTDADKARLTTERDDARLASERANKRIAELTRELDAQRIQIDAKTATENELQSELSLLKQKQDTPSTAQRSVNPIHQSDQERFSALKKRVEAAQACLDRNDYQAFLSEYVDPFHFVRVFHRTSVPVKRLIQGYAQDSPEDFWVHIKRGVAQAVDREPRWRLDGRAAFFNISYSGTAEVWVFYDGQWYISSEVIRKK